MTYGLHQGAHPVPKRQDIFAASTPRIACLNIAYVPENMGVSLPTWRPSASMLLAARTAKRAEQMDDKRLQWIFQLFPAVEEEFWNPPGGQAIGRTADAGGGARHRGPRANW